MHTFERPKSRFSTRRAARDAPLHPPLFTPLRAESTVNRTVRQPLGSVKRHDAPVYEMTAMTSSIVMNFPLEPSPNSTSEPEKPFTSTLSPALTPFTSEPMDATLPVMDEPGPVFVSAEESKMPPEVVVSGSSAITSTRAPVGFRSFTLSAAFTATERRPRVAEVLRAATCVFVVRVWERALGRSWERA